MAEEKRTSDAVRITRIVAPTVLIIALALIFKGELSGSMNRGCFEISIEHAGIDMKDQSLCSMNDINQMAGEMTQIGASKAEQRADSAFAEYEKLLSEMGQKQKELQEELIHASMAQNETEEKAFSLAREMEGQISAISNAQVQEGAQMMYKQFVEAFDVPQFQVEESHAIVEPIPQPNVQQISSDIRTRYVKKTQVDVQQVQKQIKVKRK